MCQQLQCIIVGEARVAIIGQVGTIDLVSVDVGGYCHIWKLVQNIMKMI